MTRNVASSWVASSITPIISAMPAGSLTPASPSSVVPERPPISRPPRTEKTTAGSVGASAAPTTPASFQSIPSNWAQHGVTFQDPDGFRVVLVPERWEW